MVKKSPAKQRASKAVKKRARKRAVYHSFEEQLRAAITTVDVANSLTAPLALSIENLLSIAAESVGCDEASVLVRDGNRGGLKFMVAIGEVADKVMKVRIPPGKGIGNFVFATGQPLAVADVAQEETFYAEVDRATGYSTHTIMATPLRANGKIVGVLEFVNRIGSPPYEPFTPGEMDRAADYANAIATLVEAHERAGLIETMFEQAIENATHMRGSDASEAVDLRKWLKSVRAAPEHKDLISLAINLREIASRGDGERELCRDMLDALERFTGKCAATNTTYFGF
ncbi:MAG: GAF domain-containing protein [Pyrinomonadaceae bacterium]